MIPSTLEYTKASSIDEAVAEFGSDTPLQWWSEPVLMSTEARRAFVEPDLAVPPFTLTT